MNRLTLVHLTFLGVGKPPATVEFSPGLTVIYGASETGKSYVEKSVDYMLGASTLKPIPEDEGYSRILLGLRVDDGRVMTLSRGLADSNIDVFHRDLRDLTTAPADATLNFKHSPSSQRNISRYLLKALGIDGLKILRNSRGEVRSLSFRDLIRLSVINDSRMAGERSPVLTTGLPQNETGEKSVLKLLLTGQDEPVGPTAPGSVEKKVGKGQVEILDRLIDDNREKLTIPANQSELREQLARLQTSLDAATSRSGQLIASRSALVRRRRDLEASDSANQQRASEVRQLLSRFALLREQYESDLGRLRMVGEAGNLLGYFQTGTCVFCGADPEHQHAEHHLAETTQLAAAVAAETRKTTDLHRDLITTIEDLEDQWIDLDAEIADHAGQLRRIDSELRVLEEQLEPLTTDTSEVLAARSRLEQELTIHAQIEQLEEMKASLSNALPAPPPARPDGIPAADITDFEQVIHQTLQAWHVPGENRVTYNPTSAEIAVDGRPRGSRGQGMRSIIHAAFAVSLARRATARDLIHPGFVVLDSPVVTYRQPDNREADPELMTHAVVEHFYQDLLDDPPGQVIIIENGTPPATITERARIYAFNADGSERLGFFPPQEPLTGSP
ncbi:hypothetical protein [Streptomyces viridosporus]|uniref:hypothetical protein n=1 Tax=Streptomyces viridosporus TaxID=67581 RepID=UPI003328C92C